MRQVRLQRSTAFSCDGWPRGNLSCCPHVAPTSVRGMPAAVTPAKPQQRLYALSMRYLCVCASPGRTRSPSLAQIEPNGEGEKREVTVPRKQLVNEARGHSEEREKETVYAGEGERSWANEAG